MMGKKKNGGLRDEGSEAGANERAEVENAERSSRVSGGGGGGGVGREDRQEGAGGT